MEHNRQFGNYVIMQDEKGAPRLLGSGTFGRTYLAQHQLLETQAALKVIQDRSAAEPAARERFLREGRALVKLNHRHIARLLDFGEVDEQLYYAMEYCPGGDFAQRIKAKGPLSTEAWVRVARQLASALECCHRAGFFHRDLKPSNVMLTELDGPITAKLIDFGLVHTAQQAEPGEQTIVGTPLYASPEQLREEEPDARSDLFSLGMTLWHLAIGAPPETGSSARIIESRLSPESYAARIPAQLPPLLREVITRLVEKEKAARPASASEVLSMLRGAGPSSGDDLAREEELDAAETMAIPPEVVEPMPVETVGHTLESAYVPEGLLMEQHTGANRIGHAKAPPGGRWWLHVIHPPLVADRLLFDKLRVGATRLQRHPGNDCLRPVALRAFEDATVLIMPAPGGMVLAELLKLTGKCSFAAALPLLRRIAETSDRLVLDGLPGVELRANRIFVSPEAVSGGESFQLALVPQLLPQEETRDLASMLALGDGMSNTITLELLEEEGGTDAPVPLFARLVYRLVAGRDCVAAASASDRAYVRVAELSEKNNTLLRQIIAGQTQRATCAALLAELQGLGANTGSFIHSGGKSRSATDSAISSRPRSEPFPSVAAPSASAVGSRPGSAVSSAAQASAPALPSDASVAASASRSRQAIFAEAPVSPTRPAVEVEAVAPHRSRSALIGAIAAVLVLVGVAWSWMSRGPAEHVPEPPVAGVETIPSHAALQVLGDIPDQVTWTVGETPAKLNAREGKAELPLPSGAHLPLAVTARAPGYQPFRYTLTKLADLPQAVPFALERAKGSVAIPGGARSDYIAVSARMIQALPGDEGRVPVNRFTTRFELAANGQGLRFDLPTGIYQLSLIGMNHAVRTRSWQNVTVAEGGEQSCALPPSYAGHFSGELTTGGDAADTEGARIPVEINLSSTLNEGELREKQRIALSDIQVDSAGILTATARPAAAPQTPVFDQSLTAQLSADGNAIEVKLTEAFGTAPEGKAGPQRPAYSETEWFRRGTLLRQK